MATVRPRRSVLFVPGSNARMQDKARSVAADAIVLDLEDSVAPEVKEAARDLSGATVRAGGFGRREVVIRVNGPDTPWFEPDLVSAASARPDAVLLTKAERPEQISRARMLLARSGAGSEMAIWAMIETPRGVLNCQSIAEAGPAGLVVGTNDILKDIGGRRRPDRLAVTPFLSQIVLVGRANGLFVLDGVFNDFSDLAGFAAECEQGRDLGFDGKTLIHPAQIDGANRSFAPDPAEVEEARRIIAAFAEPENRGKGAIRLDGRMVELLHAHVAARTLALAQAIVALGSTA